MMNLVAIARDLSRIGRRLETETAEGAITALLNERETITRILCRDWATPDYSPLWQYPNETRFF